MSQNTSRFHAIPESSPIPPGIVALIGGMAADEPVFGLYRNGKEIYIHAPAAEYFRNEISEDDEFYDWKMLQQRQQIFDYYLRIIQSLLTQIDFGRTKIGYLTRNETTKEYRIIQRQQDIVPPSHQFSCNPWATFIPESEIEVTVWGGLSDRRGIWKRKGARDIEVDIFYAWSAAECKFLNAAMRGYRAALELDLVYEVYGHLEDRHGHIIGLVSEAAWGRMVEPSDKSLVFSAIAKLERRGCIYKGCLTNRLMIAGNKVRLLELDRIITDTDPEKFAEEAQLYHWDHLCQLFEELDQFGPYGNNRLPLLRFTSSPHDIIFLPHTSSPTLRIRLSKFSPIRKAFTPTYGLEQVSEGEDDREERRHSFYPASNSVYGHRRPLEFPQPLASSRITTSPSSHYPEDFVITMRAVGTPLPRRSRNHELVLSHHPYRRPSRTRSETAYYGEDSSSEDTGSSITVS